VLVRVPVFAWLCAHSGKEWGHPDWGVMGWVWSAFWSAFLAPLPNRPVSRLRCIDRNPPTAGPCRKRPVGMSHLLGHRYGSPGPPSPLRPSRFGLSVSCRSPSSGRYVSKCDYWDPISEFHGFRIQPRVFRPRRSYPRQFPAGERERRGRNTVWIGCSL